MADFFYRITNTIRADFNTAIRAPKNSARGFRSLKTSGRVDFSSDGSLPSSRSYPASEIREQETAFTVPEISHINPMKRIIRGILNHLPVTRDILRTSRSSAPITWRGLFFQKILGFNRKAYWPMHFTSKVTQVENICIGIGVAPGLSPGCYIQGINGINIGDYTMVAANVGIISANHDPLCPSRHEVAEPIRIGRYCWIGMNSVILPEVRLGDHTVVGAGSVVTRSFPEGFCVIGGVPARVIKKLDSALVDEQRAAWEYIGFHSLAGSSVTEIYRKVRLRNHDDCFS